MAVLSILRLTGDRGHSKLAAIAPLPQAPGVMLKWMMRCRLIGFTLLAVSAAVAGGANYKNFDVALYSRVYETQQMKDPVWLESHWAAVTKYMKVDKIYLQEFPQNPQPSQV